ncbi:hypothetical protein [Rhizobium sp. CECT 9324]|uniref:hypothetical protein n=1 Tax=Rhizobium sp. CECT 9324 TaxID=2845820 RepID=UPI001E33D825|nr:hypothetical protein [Rhizobium sp. CECT 9324]CAH0341936.1 hypothetical protein RHI9324_03644 [Rhizobium sp. CECT 9324]
MTHPPHDPETSPDLAADRQMVDLNQRAGLDMDLGSKVQPRYGAATVAIMVCILMVMVAAVVWIVL